MRKHLVGLDGFLYLGLGGDLGPCCSSNVRVAGFQPIRVYLLNSYIWTSPFGSLLTMVVLAYNFLKNSGNFYVHSIYYFYGANSFSDHWMTIQLIWI